MLNLASVFSRSFCFTIVLAAATTVLPGCFGLGSDSSRHDDDDDNDDGDRNDDDGDGPSGQSCGDPEDCPNIACLCDDASSLGAPVNAKHCTNERCETASQACPDACAAFGYDWTGSVVGGSGSGSGSGSGGSPPGYTCDVASDCAAHTCSCPDGTVSDVRDCYDNVCYGADLCSDQCCALGHC